jgi:hypothetical protein
MIRMLLYLLLAYIAWKMIKIVSTSRKQTHREREEDTSAQTPPIEFPNIEEAKFEDLPPSSSDDGPSSPKR